eukprot:gene9078-10720_t
MTTVKRDPPTKALDEDINFFSFIFMTYLDTLFKVANEKTLELGDLGAAPTANRADVLYPIFKAHYLKQKHLPTEKRSLWHCIWSTVGYWRFFSAIFLFGISAGVQLGPVLILTRLVNYLQDVTDYKTSSVWIMVSLLFVFPLVSSVALAHSNSIMAHIGTQTRNILIDALYRKSLTISPAKKLEISTGRILTMFSDDTNQIKNFLVFVTNAILAPLQIGACLFLIYQQVGVAMFVGLGYSIFSMPITGVIFGFVFGIRKDKMKQTDIRVKLMNEVLNGIRIIKYYAWENAFIKKISVVRDQEVYLLRKMGYLFNIPFGILLIGAPSIQTVLIFLTYICLGHELDVSTAFTTITLFGIMTTPFIFLPLGIQQYSQSLVSMGRIIQYLDCEDLVEYINKVEPGSLVDASGNKDVVMQFKDANVAWSLEPTVVVPVAGAAVAGQDAAYKAVATNATEEGTETAVVVAEKDNGPNRATHSLVDVNLSIRKGELVGIVGTVGSGKSSFLNAVLGEMTLRSGSLSMVKDQSIAFCDQRPWIVNATVRDNITFGKELDERRLQRAIYVASMQDDLKILQGGLDCEIGERGINLSGGQKARVCLARAVYNDAEVYLLDDPLSAVDAHVGEHIFHKCIKEELKNKTVLLVTHHLHVLPQCDKIVILDDNGRVLIAGTYEEIMRSGVDVEKYLATKKEEEEGAETPVKVDEIAQAVVVEDKVSVRRVSGADKSAPASVRDDTKKSDKEGALMSKEERNEGEVPWATYWAFINAGGKWAFLITLLSQLGGQALNVYANFWLTDWGANTLKFEYTYLRDMPLSRSFFWYDGYAGMLMASVLLITISRTVLTYHRTNASHNLHALILNKVMYFPVAFFDVTPIGRIINRFSQDMATVDEDLATTMSQLIGMGGSVLGSIGAIAGSTQGTFLILMVPLSFLYSTFNAYFRKANTAIARLESVSRSPIYADFSQTLSGTTTIRAYRQNDRFVKRLEDYANTNTVPGVLQQIASQWLSIRLDFLGALVTLFMGVIAITTKNSGFISAGNLALGLSYSIQLTAMLKNAVRVAAQVEAQFNSVERIYHYAHNIPTEDEQKKTQSDRAAQLLLENSALSDGLGDIEMNNAALLKGPADRSPITPPENWPEHGEVEFVDAVMRYRDGPPVLKGVSFKVNRHDHVGIAGRTGCGKSSLMVALFRIEDLVSGTILIDGIDISRIPLDLLRNKLCIIPQDPVMFSASVRFNLDPFDEHSDEAIWAVLADVNMKEHVLSLPSQLQEQVAEGGDNFSAGQRQLICIGRALLRKPRILIMDEATASIDPETDNFIQKMIRQKFENVTMLTIAHRLHTIIDSTRVLVMDAGHVGEYDVPEVLLSKEGGLFKGLWDRHMGEGADH